MPESNCINALAFRSSARALFRLRRKGGFLPAPCATFDPEDVRVRFFRSVLFGLTTALLAAGVWIVIKFVLPITVPYLVSRFSSDNVGGSTAEITSGSVLVALFIGFAAGFLWRFRRLPQ
jgi:hypothetical protein